MSDRRYRQQGYRPDDSARREPPRRPSTDMPRSAPMLGKRTVSRCGACGAVLPVATGSLEQCPSCRAPMHACLQCTHFEPGRRFECARPIPARLVDKNGRNECPEFALRVTVERDASPDGPRPDDVRRAFQNLFKKP